MRHFLLPFALLLSVSLAAQVPSYFPADGLVSHMPLDGTIEDAFGGAGTLHGAIPSVDRIGNPNSCLEFTGNEWAEINLPAWNDLSDENSFTITCWVYATQIQDGSVIEKWTGGPYPVNIRAGSQPVLGFGMYDGTGTGFGTHTTYPYVGEWVFIVANFDFPSSTIRTILNMSDSTITSLPNSNYSNNTPLSIGRRMNRTDRFWYGKIDEITLWNRTLEPWELQQIFNGPTPGCTDPSSCNFNSEANVNDGSCIPSGCMEEGACNYNAAAECEGEACDYSCCPGPGCCGAGTHWDANLATCVVDVPDSVDAACTLMNLQELASGYAALVEQNAALDSLLSACEGDGAANASGPCAGQDHVTYHGYDYAIVEIGDQCWFAENLKTTSYSDGSSIDATSAVPFNNDPSNTDNYGLLYAGDAIFNGLGICPTSWHLGSCH